MKLGTIYELYNAIEEIIQNKAITFDEKDNVINNFTLIKIKGSLQEYYTQISLTRKDLEQCAINELKDIGDDIDVRNTVLSKYNIQFDNYLVEERNVILPDTIISKDSIKSINNSKVLDILYQNKIVIL